MGRHKGRFSLWTFPATWAAIAREHETNFMTQPVNRGSTLFLRLVICLVAIAALTVCAFPLPRMISTEAAKTPGTAWQIYLFLFGAYIQASLFLFGLYHAFRLLNYIDRGDAFSEPSVSALRYIRIAAVTIGLLMVAGTAGVLVLSAGTGEDSAGPVMMGLIGAFASSVVAAAAAVLQTLVQKAIDAQS